MFKKPGGCPHCGDRKFNAVRFVDAIKKKFPIDTPKNIKQSWDSLHEQRNINKYSKEEFKMMEEKVINAWIHHIGMGVPEAGKSKK